MLVQRDHLALDLASAVDFWALGVCLYQFLVGVTPFSDECPRAIISNILNYRLAWPDGEDEQLDDDTIRVIKGLLSYDPTSRLQLEGKRQCNTTLDDLRYS